MENKVVVIKELKTGKTRQTPPKDYPIVVDQDNEQWAIWQQTLPLELNKVYLFRFEFNDKGYKDIRQIEPLVNIFKSKVAKEMANLLEHKRDFFMALSYSKDLVMSGKLELSQMYTEAENIHKWVLERAESCMPKEN